MTHPTTPIDMKPIKVEASKKTEIEAVLERINGRASAHAFTRAAEIIALAEQGEKRLESLGIPKGVRKGAIVIATSGDKVPMAYNNRRRGTEVELHRRASGWVLVRVTQVAIGIGGGRSTLHLTRQQDAIVVSRVRAQYSILKPVTGAAPAAAAA